jgi:hypothetical protein
MLGNPREMIIMAERRFPCGSGLAFRQKVSASVIQN